MILRNRLKERRAALNVNPVSYTHLDVYKRQYLYHAYVELRSEDGEILEIIPYDIGFRRLEMIDKVIYLNGKRLVITGVNRHEWSAKTGRSIEMCIRDSRHVVWCICNSDKSWKNSSVCMVFYSIYIA